MSKLFGLFYVATLLLLLYLSGQNKKRWQWNNESEKAFVKTKEYIWHQNKDYVGGAPLPNVLFAELC